MYSLSVVYGREGVCNGTMPTCTQCVYITEVRVEFCCTSYCVRMRKDSMLMEHSMTNIISIIVVYIIMISFE